MAGIYLHIPFCRRKCHYCNFFSLASVKHLDPFPGALIREAELQRDYLQGAEVSTIYFGGGTPSMLPGDAIAGILNAISRNFSVSPSAEITLEANPDDLSPESLRAFRVAGINRLSIGIQSFHDEILHYLNRSHSAQQASRCVSHARELGFNNISVDLIYGIPGLSEEKWDQTLTTAINLGVEHISAYALTIEKGTAMELFIRKGSMISPSDDLACDQFAMLTDRLSSNGYIHYEISNFARHGFLSNHNANYWKGEPYLGLGPSAHSYNTHSRRWNISSLSQYLAAITNGETCHQEEILTRADMYNELIMTSLRTMWGCNTERVRSEFGTPFYKHLMKEAGKHLLAGTLLMSENTLYLSGNGKFIADGIISDLFYPS